MENATFGDIDVTEGLIALPMRLGSHHHATSGTQQYTTIKRALPIHASPVMLAAGPSCLVSGSPFADSRVSDTFSTALLVALR